MNPLRIVIAGARGRMGSALIRAIADEKDLTLVGALAPIGRAYLGQDAGALAGGTPAGIAVTGEALPLVAASDAIIDFTTPKTSVELAALAAQARIVHVVGTTGFTPEDESKIKAAARHAVVVKSGNMSLGIALLEVLVKQAARALPDFDIEILETHHRHKVDAPSGTALMLGHAAAQGRNVLLDEKRTETRQGARPEGAIGITSLRGGTVVGEHRVMLAGRGERIELNHIAEDRAIFARGALAAARWGRGKKPGLYKMADVLGLAPS
ncbi:MAG TPA: 4-hydroxy-tetrahydrodipicolinate reductase [Rhizomicrobium sp.]|nr:4-hydroxy-tetrahydrodipicolinate reductase [Rhizomicrobium sp.]